jgi:hypothetical protein
MILSNVLKRPMNTAVVSATVIAILQANVAAAASTLTISGQPATTVSVGQTYSFTPYVNRSSRYVRFKVTNKPKWLYFSSYGGTLYGVPRSSNVGTYSNIIITVSDGRSTAKLAPFSITVNGTTTSPTPTPTPTPEPTPEPTPTPTNTAPTISGAPLTTINSGTAYSFKPSASDANGDALTFSIAGKPSWAAFNTSTGLMSGTPAYANAGVYSNIVISVSDGQATTSMAAFSLTVNQVATGRATISWLPPTTNTDGTSLSNLAGYRISYGTSSTSLNKVTTVASAGVTDALIEELAPGTWYFAVKAYTSTGTESSASTVASKQIN